MTQVTSVGLGELLRHFTDLLDSDADRANERMGVGPYFRARYTPILRALGPNPLSITELQQRIRMTQGAISQTVKLMEADGLLRRVDSEDRRSRKVVLTEKGESVLRRLSEEWNIRLTVIAELEDEIGVPLRSHLAQAIASLEQESYDARIEKARARLAHGSTANASR